MSPVVPIAAAVVGASGFLSFKGNMAAAKAARQTADAISDALGETAA